MSHVTNDVFSEQQFTKLFPALRPIVNELFPVSLCPVDLTQEGA